MTMIFNLCHYQYKGEKMELNELRNKLDNLKEKQEELWRLL